jgi:hypothetical protein
MGGGSWGEEEGGHIQHPFIVFSCGGGGSLGLLVH